MNLTQETRLAEWMRQSQQGNSQAYHHLLTEVHSILKGFVTYKLRGNDNVDEVIQEILLSIHQARHSYDPSRKFGPWLFAIARHRIVDYFRRQAKRMEREVESDTIWDTLAAPEAEDLDLSDQLLEALAQLPDKQRQAVQALKVQGLSVKEAAAHLKMSESAVKVNAHRAYERLREKFGAKKDGNVSTHKLTH